ncbi:hypothetical protein GHJ83_27710 [Sinorhizobium meliloti]|nr:hypothetical protein [Sinorhizobium meliloti]
MRSPLRVGLASSRRASRRSTAVGDRSPCQADAERAREEGAKSRLGQCRRRSYHGIPRRRGGIRGGKATPGEIAAAGNGAHAPACLERHVLPTASVRLRTQADFQPHRRQGSKAARSARNCAMKSDTDADAAERLRQARERQREREQTGRGNGKAEISDLSDIGLAFDFADEVCGQFRYIAPWNKWFQWDGRRWDEERTLAVYDRAIRFVAAKNNSAIAKREKASAIHDLCRADRRIAATVEQWDAEPFILNTPGGIVDLKTGLVLKSDPQRYCTKMTAVAPKAMATPLWDAFVHRIFDGNGLDSYFYRMLGYALTGDTREHALFFGYGTGGNGKSVTVKTVSGILGDYAKTASIETFTASANDRHPTELAFLRGARLVVATETEEGRRWDESKIKQLTGGDRIAARFMRQDFFEFDPAFKLLIVGNHKPSLRTVDEAIRRRLQLIPFTVTIPDEEKDKELCDKLKPEWPGILYRMVQGCIEWQTSGLEPPPAVIDATAEYLASEDVIADWIDECCEINPQFDAASTELFNSWRAWAEKAGEFVGSQKKFAEKLESRGYIKVKTNSIRKFIGLRVKQSQQWSAYAD